MRTIISVILFCISVFSLGQRGFDKFFTNNVLRFDFILSGNHQKTYVYPMGMKEEPRWAGSINNLINS